MTEYSEEKHEKKLGFFKKVYYSITRFEKYPQMAAEGTVSSFKYLGLLMLVFSLIVSIGLVVELRQTIKSGVDYIQNDLPDMKYINGELNVNSNAVINIDTTIPAIDHIIIDTSTDSEEQINKYMESIPTDNTGIIVLKNKILVKAVETNQRIEYTYKEILESLNINQDMLTKQDIINYLTGSGVISIYLMFFVLMIAYVFIIYSISVLVDTLLIAVLGNITTLFIKLKLKFSAVYNMSIYALTLSILLNALYTAINCVTGFEMSYFQIMYTSIAYVYLVAAIFLIRIDFEKKQAELMKIIEEQKKVKQDMKEQKEETEKDENKKPEDDDLEEKEKKHETGSNKGEPSESEA